MPSGRKPKPPGTAVTRHQRAHEWQHAAGEGWQHGRRPACPDGLLAASRKAWGEWMSSWWAAHWKPGDLPQLRAAIKAYDQVERGNLDIAKLVPLLDRLGITPKGRQDLRWAPPSDEPAKQPSAPSDEIAKRRQDRAKRIS